MRVGSMEELWTKTRKAVKLSSQRVVSNDQAQNLVLVLAGSENPVRVIMDTVICEEADGLWSGEVHGSSVKTGTKMRLGTDYSNTENIYGVVVSKRPLAQNATCQSYGVWYLKE